MALEVMSTGRAAVDRGGIARADPADEQGEFALGCAAHPRRTAQARVLAQSSVAKYMVKQRGPPSQGWLAYETVKIEPQTLAGVLIQARVLTAYAEVEIEVGHYRGRSGQLVGLALAQSLTRLSIG
jgi:hypothetical protein